MNFAGGSRGTDDNSTIRYVTPILSLEQFSVPLGAVITQTGDVLLFDSPYPKGIGLDYVDPWKKPGTHGSKTASFQRHVTIREWDIRRKVRILKGES